MPIRLKNPFKTELSLEELQERQERDEYNLSHIKVQTLIKELEVRKKKWQDFSSNGKKSGFSVARAMAWLRGNKGGKK
jgi:hypothetical protein